MFGQDYLSLRLVRLKPSEFWNSPRGPFTFLFCRVDGGKCTVGSTCRNLSQGDVLAFDGTGDGKVEVGAGQELIFWWFSVNVEHLYPLFAANEISLLDGVADNFKGLRAYAASGAIARECHRLVAEVAPQFDLEHRSQLLRIATVIVAEELKKVRGNRPGYVRAQDHLMQVFEKLSSNDLLGLSVGELASRFGCSRRHLNRLFHQHFGFSVASLRMEMRLIKAVSLLRNPDVKVINVAEQCGFNHLGLFNTCFRRRFGASPGQWRKLHSQAEAKPRQQIAAQTDCPLRSNGLCPWSGKPEVTPGPAQHSFLRKRTTLEDLPRIETSSEDTASL